MAYCAVPDITTTKSRPVTPASLSAPVPNPTGELCDTTIVESTLTSGSTTPSTNTIVQGPPGPPGPVGPPGTGGGGGGGGNPHDGITWAGEWTDGTEYFPNDDSVPRHADVVRVDGALFVCISQHIAGTTSRPRLSTYEGEASLWEEFWALMIEPPAETPTQEEKSFLGDLFNGVFDWMKKATLGDWLLAGLIGTGIIWAGTKILESFTDDGSGGATDPDSRYNGSPSYDGAYTPPSIRSVVESLCIYSGIESYDVSLLPTDKYCQFSLSQNTSVRNILDNIAKAFQFDMVDSSGTLKFVPRNSSSVRTLTYDDLSFTSTGETISPFTIKRLQSIDLPRSISLTYIAEELDYNNFSQVTEIPTFADGNSISLSVPFVMEHSDAKLATEQLLIGAHLERMQYSFKTWYKTGIDLEPGDAVTLPTGDVVRIIQIEEIEDGILEITGVDAGIPAAPQPIIVGGVTVGYTASSYYGTGQNPQLPTEPSNPAPVISKSGVFYIDPPVLDSDDLSPRIYAVVHNYGVEGWPGAQIFRSIDGGASYSLIGSTSANSSWGLVGTAIGAAPYYTWDDSTVITVQMKTGTLVSKTDDAVLAGENQCMVGQECISFGVATLISPGTYQLSHLLRGRRGTEWAIGNHVANELFIFFNAAPFKIECSDSDRGKTYKYKVVTYGSDLTKVEATDVQIIGNNTIPWTACNLNGSRNSVSKIWTLNWIERPRFNNGIINYTEIPHDPDWGGYAIRIYSGTTVVRQEIVYNTTYAYSLSNQITDFGAEQTTLKFGVSQISNKYGGGRETIVNI